ncbi:sulfite exporter TauE/SafE family protein [Bacillus sp. FJAT-42315]|uniref:sulfite exporter TauE/SafE family protein n=1 Tax=Bacillus sp. FJAT-42315 TaxID=2014077 RepID=UPI0022B7F5C3|nr:sulfite exporter TauE/SafE family protein [Bacillus sp. FJAT-42315]
MGMGLLFIGIVSGAYGVMIGAGGGFIFVPALLLLFHLSPATAAGTGLAVVCLNAISGVIGYKKQGHIHYRFGFILAAGALPGIFIGAKFTSSVSPDIFNDVFGSTLMVLGGFLLYQNIRETRKGHASQNEEVSL